MKEKTNYKRITIISVIVVVLFWAMTFLLFNWSEQFRGTFGDMFGAVNALFSGLAFGGIILTIYMQREELALQRKELEETRKVFEKQSTIMSNQQNDVLFFNLLENHRQMVHSFDKKQYRFTLPRKGDYSVNKELESGYQFISNVADAWREYLTLYSEMHRTQILYAFKELKYIPLDIIDSEENIRSFVKESIQLADFVDRKFGDTKDYTFYKNTLNISLLESEKFIISAWNSIMLDQNGLSPFGMDWYDKYNFIDFTKCTLPTVKVSLNKDGIEDYKFNIKSEGALLRYFSIIEHEPDEEGKRVLEVCSKDILKKDENYQLTVIDYLKDSTMEIESNPVKPDYITGLSLRGYYVVFEILYEGLNYYLPFEFTLKLKEVWKTKSNNHEELYHICFESRSHLIIKKNKAMELIEEVRKN